MRIKKILYLTLSFVLLTGCESKTTYHSPIETKKETTTDTESQSLHTMPILTTGTLADLASAQDIQGNTYSKPLVFLTTMKGTGFTTEIQLTAPYDYLEGTLFATDFTMPRKDMHDPADLMGELLFFNEYDELLHPKLCVTFHQKALAIRIPLQDVHTLKIIARRNYEEESILIGIADATLVP